MHAGVLDETKARSLSEWTRDLTPEHAATVADRVLGDVERLTNGALIERIQDLAVALDPEWAARREDRARRRARVVGSSTPEGTASLAGYDLPLDETVDALARIETLADRVRAGGIHMPINQLRATVYLRQLRGFGAGLDDTALVHALITALRDPGPDDGTPGPPRGPDSPDSPDSPNRPDAGRDGPDGPGSPDRDSDDESDPEEDSDDSGLAESGSDEESGPDEDSGSDDSDVADHEDVDQNTRSAGAGGRPPSEAAHGTKRGPASATPACGNPGTGNSGAGNPAAGAAAAGSSGLGDPTKGGDDPAGNEDEEDPVAPPVEDAPPPVRGRRRGTVELRVRLSTLLGLDDLPARVPTWGVLLAAHARAWVAAHPDAEWRLVLTDDHGRLRHVLLTRHRPRPTPASGSPPTPASPPGRSRARPRGIIEIQVPDALLRALDPAAHRAWAPLLADARRWQRDLPPDGDPDRRPAADAAGRRRAHAELDRWVRTRDRHCIAPGCRRPALACDLDHTRDWAHDGPSAAWNLGALCRRHHRLKHLGGWTLTQPAPGRFHWRTRAGATYRTGARAVTDPLPPPAPRPDGRRRPLGADRIVPTPRDGLRPVPGQPGPTTRHPRVEPDLPFYVGAAFTPAGPRQPASRSPADDEPPPF